MATERADDPAIRNEDELWRFVHPSQIYLDPQTNRRRPKSGASIDRNAGEMSVDVARLPRHVQADSSSTATIRCSDQSGVTVIGWPVNNQPVQIP